MRIRPVRFSLGVVLLLLCSGCALFTRPDHFEARQITFAELNGWQADSHGEALQTFLASCPLLAQRPRPATTESGIAVSKDVWASLCADAARSSGQAKAFFERRFTPFRISNNRREEGLFTGYYEPVLYGSRKKGHDFVHPIYAVPPELKDSKPYYTRQQIDEGALANRKLELLWVDDPVMLFFMHIQGSGRVKLTDGKEIRIGYGDQNGQGYVALGKIFADEEILPKDQINFFTLRQWLYMHPHEAIAMMQRNPSFVFFKENTGDGPIGATGAVLTPQRSLAVDHRHIPYGLPLFLEVDLPAQPARQPVPFHRLMIAQDTGGAIRGPVRGDVFFGAGDAAEYYAGYMRGRGIYSLLVPNETVPQLRPWPDVF